MKLLNEATSMAIYSMEVNGSKVTFMEVGGSFHGSRFISVKVGGIKFHVNSLEVNLPPWK